MLIYKCKNCGKLLIGGVANEFDERFCRAKCYEDYCKRNHYVADFDKLKVVKIVLND